MAKSCKDCIHSGVCVLCQLNQTCLAFKNKADVVEVRHGWWMLEAHNERVNYRWNVTAECSECCNGEKKIWAGFFPNVPDYLAKSVALQEAEQVELDNYCPNCGAKMDGGVVE
jgi:hypothetical protein